MTELTDEQHEVDVIDWVNDLEGAPSFVEFPSDLPRPRVLSRDTTVVPVLLDAATLTCLRGEDEQLLTPTLVAIWQALLHRYTNESDLVIGLYSEDITHHLVPLRANVDGSSSVEAMATAVSDALGRDRSIPIESLVDALRVLNTNNKHPVFQAAFATMDLQSVAPAAPVFVDGYAPCDLLFVTDSSNPGMGWIQFPVGLFSQGHVQRISANFSHLAQSCAADRFRPIATLDLLAPSETAQINAWSEAAFVDHDASDLSTFIEGQLLQFEHRTALEYDGQALSYRQLLDRGRALARELRSQSIGPNDRVAVTIPRSFDMVVAVLGTLLAGASYVPIDSDYPQNRREFMLAQSDVRAVLSSSSESGVVVTMVNPAASSGNLAAAVASDLAYVVYTSGSTGTPKGVAMTRGALRNLLQWQLSRPGFDSPQRTLQFTSLSFDVSFQEIFSTLATGGTLVLVSDAQRRDPRSLLSIISTRGIQRLFVPFVALRGLAGAAVTEGTFPTTLAQVITAGEQVVVDETLRAFFEGIPGCSLENQYGPSETHVVTAFVLPGDCREWETLPPIGTPISNVQIHILDQYLNAVPMCVPAEMYVGGACLARGYLGDPDLTDAKFMVIETRDQRSVRVYRTGDKCRWRHDGTLEFLGRVDDQQVKFRGFRIEPGEISSVLSTFPDVDQCVVAVRPIEGSGSRLVAYITTETTGVDLSGLHEFARAELPEHMVPSHFTVVAKFPLTASGKVDVQALPVPQFNREILGVEFRAAATVTESRLVRIWERLLGISTVGVDDDFFTLGGDSLMAVEMFEAIRAGFSRDLPLGALASGPTIAALAAAIDSDGEDSWPVVVPLRKSGRQTPLFIVHGGTGNIASFPKLARALPDDQPVYGIQWDGLAGTGGAQTIEEMASLYMNEVRRIQPQGPYRLAGQCVGGLVAREMATRELDRGGSVELLVMYDSPNVGSPAYIPLPATPLWRRLIRAIRNRTIHRYRARGTVRPMPVLTDREQRGGTTMGLATSAYRPRPLDVQTLYFYSGGDKDDTGKWTDGAWGFKSFESERFRIETVIDHHNHMMYNPVAVKVLSDSLTPTNHS